MKFLKNIRLPEFTPEQKKKVLRYSLITVSVLFLLLILLLLMKCEGCSSESKRKRNFGDGKGHSYNSEISSSDVFRDEYENVVSVDSDMESEKERLERERLEKDRLEKIEKERLEKEKQEKEKLNKEAQKKEQLEKERLEKERQKKEQLEKEKQEKEKKDKEKRLAEEKKRADEKARKEAEAKRKAEEEKKAKKEAEARKKEEEKLKAEEARQKAEEEKKRTEEARRKAEENAASLETANKSSEKDRIVSKLEDITKRLSESENESEKQKLLEEGVTLAKELIDQGVENDSAHYIIAQDLTKKRKYENALSELEKAIALNESNYLYYYDMGKLQYLLKRFGDASASFIRSCELNDHFSPSRYNLGLTYVKLKDENKALDSFKQSVKINPEYEKGYIEQARVYNRLGMLSECVKAYDTLIQRFPDNVSAIMELGSVYYQYGQYEKSESQYKIALEMLSKSEESTLTAYNLSKVLYDQGKYKEAQKYAWQAYDNKDFLLNDTQQANIVYNYALVQEKLDKTEDAQKLYNEAISLNPEHTKSKINLSALYMAKNPPEVDMALELLAQAYRENNEDFSVNNNLGTAWMLKGDYEKSISYYKKALSITVNDEDALSNIANVCMKAGKVDEAVEYFTVLTVSYPDNLDGFIGLAKVLIQKGDGNKAYKNLLYVKQKNPEYRKAEVDSLIAVLN